jgi:hypothetical protein
MEQRSLGHCHFVEPRLRLTERSALGWSQTAIIQKQLMIIKAIWLQKPRHKKENKIPSHVLGLYRPARFIALAVEWCRQIETCKEIGRDYG